ncbi:MAG: prepilin-type N-terminal cleavage/methylation domain-containing protein [Patescibacteria group bacterium]
MNQRGFTLIEFVIYIGIVTFVLIASLTFAWTIINDQIKQGNLIEVNYHGGFIMQKVLYYSQRASTVDAQTVYNTNPGKLVLNYPTNPQIVIDTYQKQITLGGNPVTITKLRFQEGVSTAIDLTSDEVTVNNFSITNLSTANVTTFRVDLDLEAVNPSGSKTYEAQNAWTISATLRQK